MKYNRKYTKELIEPLVISSYSISELLDKLVLQHTGGNYSHMYKVIKQFNLDTSHFKGRGWNKGKTFPPKIPTEKILSNEQRIKSHDLRKRLIKEGYFEPKCYHCQATTWFDIPIPLELHHKDNNHENNNIDNLLLVCPNCHTYLHNLARSCHAIKCNEIKPVKNKTSNKVSIKNKVKLNRKVGLRPQSRKVTRPDLTTLQQDIQNIGYSATGRKYGVSDNAIRKWVKTYIKYTEISPN